MNRENTIERFKAIKMPAPALAEVLAVFEEFTKPALPNLRGTYPDTDGVRRRINLLYKRRETTKWSDKEQTALKKAQIDLQDLAVVEEARRLGYEYYRRDILTLLNNWNAEVDRSRFYIAEET